MISNPIHNRVFPLEWESLNPLIRAVHSVCFIATEIGLILALFFLLRVSPLPPY